MKQEMKEEEQKRLQRAAEALFRIRSAAPLIHCITSPIAINDCANALLALGARPIMAEHPKEAAGITALSRGLSVSLANITDARAESLLISGKEAFQRGIPSVIDAVGVNCSPFRLELAGEFLQTAHPAVIKGNATELRTLAGLPHGESGIDTAEGDRLLSKGPEAAGEAEQRLAAFAAAEGAVILASGAADLVTDGRELWAVENGVPELSGVTGTGCMLSCLVAAALSMCEGDPLTAALLAAGIMGIAGEAALEMGRPGTSAEGEAGRAETGRPGDDQTGDDGTKAGERSGEAVWRPRMGLGSFHAALFDAFSLLTPEEFLRRARFRRLG